MELNGERFTAAAEDAAWRADAKAIYHEMGEEIVRTAAAPLLIPMDVRHINGPRIAGEIQAKGGGVSICVRRAFAGIGAELEIKVGYETDVVRNDDVCNMDVVTGRVRALAERQGLPVFGLSF